MTAPIRLNHYSVAVHDLDAAVADHRARFGVEPIGERSVNRIGDFDVQRMGYGDEVLLHLISPRSDDSALARLMRDRVNDLNPHGEGVYLLAYDCDDVDAFCAQVEANGGRVNRAPGSPNAWVHPTSSNFVLMELIQAQ